MQVVIKTMGMDRILWQGECRIVFMSSDETVKGNRVAYMGEKTSDPGKVFINLQKTPESISMEILTELTAPGNIWIGHASNTACDNEFMLTFGGGRR